MIDNLIGKEGTPSPELIESVRNLRGLKKYQLQAIADAINSLSDSESKDPIVDAIRTELLNASADTKEEWSQKKR